LIGFFTNIILEITQENITLLMYEDPPMRIPNTKET
jgi:hypothetical protein